MMKIESNLGPYYLKLVKDFIINILKEFNNAGSKDFGKVHVCGCCFGFPHTIINEYFGRGNLITKDRIPPLKVIAQEITGSVYEIFPRKGLIHIGSLSVKYVILNIIGVFS